MTARPAGMDPAVAHVWRRSISVDGPTLRQLESVYLDTGRVTDDEWGSIVTTAAAALLGCPNPAQPAGQAVGLGLGKVQSGKTLSYSALIALALDNNYRVAVVLAGTKNPLLEQTYARLVHDLGASGDVLVAFRNPPPADADVIHSLLHSGGRALIVVLKNRRRIDDAIALLGSPELRGFPTLIIDDEGDEASLNTQFRSGRQSAIYRSILRLRQVLPLHAYVAYTATPQANLLIAGVDALSPDFAVLVEPGSGYCGGSVFFGEHLGSYVRAVSPDEADAARAGEVTPGLMSAVALFIVGAAIRSLRSDRHRHSMLLHVSNLTAEHVALQLSVRGVLTLWREMLTLPENDPSLVNLHSLMRQAYDDLTCTVRTSPTWNEVWQAIGDEVWGTEVWLVNSLPIGRDPIATPFRLKNNILVGGNMLGRGVTLDGLAVTYITREAQQDTNADTLEQRARWFGYKQNYLDVCRIFLTGRLRDRYAELLRHEDDFWEALRRNQRQGLSVREWPRLFRLDADTWQLRPTRSSVASFRQFTGQGWDVQRRVILSSSVAAANVAIARSFFQSYPGTPHRYGNVEHHLARGLSPEIVISELLGHLEAEGTDWDKPYVEEYLARLQLGARLNEMDVLLMSCGQFRDRATDDTGRINPMQGRSPGRQPDDPSYYPGDENIHGDRVHLQMHLIRTRPSAARPAVETTALALYIPNQPEYDLRAIVRA